MKKTASWIDTSHLRNQDGVDGYGPASLPSLLPMLHLRGCTCMEVLVQGRPCLWTCSMNNCKYISSGQDFLHTTS